MAALELSVRNASAVIANVRRLPARAKAEVRRVVRDAAAECHDLAYFFAPVDTGFLREHIREVISAGGLAWQVGWDATDFIDAGLPPYFFATEEGTRFMAPRPCITPAFEEVRPAFLANLQRAMDNAVLGTARSRVGASE